MGYNTEFRGVLFFGEELTLKEMRTLEGLLDTEELENYIDLEMTSDDTGLEWSGSEKTYGMVKAVNYIIESMMKEFPHFRLLGSLRAEGKDQGDVWELRIKPHLSKVQEAYKWERPSIDDEDMALMPKSLTAENGAKALMSGEFFEEHGVVCGECYGDGCRHCDETGVVLEKVTVSWTTIKEIYKMAVDNLEKKD